MTDASNFKLDRCRCLQLLTCFGYLTCVQVADVRGAVAGVWSVGAETGGAEQIFHMTISHDFEAYRKVIQGHFCTFF